MELQNDDVLSNISLFLCSSHWYLAIICYPGLTSPEFENRTQQESTDETSEMNSRKAKSKGRTDSSKKSEVNSDA